MSSIEDSIKEMIPQMTAEVAEKIRERALSNIEYSVAQAVQEEAKKHVAEVVIPAVREQLVQHEAEIKAAVLAAIKGIAEQIAKTLVQKATAKLAGYEGDKLIKDMFGPMFRGY